MRRTSLLLIAVVVALGVAAPASAGGYDQFFYNRRYFRPGETVHLSQRVYAQNASAVTNAGPYRAYLLPETRRWWRGRSNEEGLPLGEVETEPARDGHYVRAVLTFTVPEHLEPGPYVLEVCNTTCRKWLGALGPTEIGIAATQVEARLQRSLDHVGRRLDNLHFQASRRGMSRDVRVLTSALGDRLDALEEETLPDLGRLVERLQARLEESAGQPWYRPWVSFAGAALLGAVAGLVGGSMVARVRRAIIVPRKETRPSVAA